MLQNNKKIFLWLLVLLVVGGTVLILSRPILAGDAAQTATNNAAEQVLGNLGAAGRPSGLTGDSLVDVVSLVVRGVLGLVAIIFFIMILIAGFSWMTAGGNEQTVSNAKKNMANAIIGLAVILFSYAITYFVFDVLLKK